MRNEETGKKDTGEKNRRIRLLLIAAILVILAFGAGWGCAKKQTPQETGQSAQSEAAAAQASETAQGATDYAATSETEQAGALETKTARTEGETTRQAGGIDRDGVYDSKDDVALYLYTYGKLPSNYITKDEARKLGWSGGSVEDYAPGKCIGGDRFGNYEGKLPKGNYHECDIDTLDWRDRGSRRLVYSDEEIYYTDDHYRTFTLLYDKDGKR